MKFSVSRTDGQKIPDYARFFVLRVDGAPGERAAERAAVREYVRLAGTAGQEAALELLREVGAGEEDKLAPGPYSVFVMHSGGEWEQPTFILDEPETEEKLLRWAEARFSGFQASLLGRDEDAPDHVLEDAYHYPGDV